MGDRRWDAILRRAPDPRLGAEVGVWRGECSRHLLRMAPGLTLIMVDPWEPFSSVGGGTIGTLGRAAFEEAFQRCCKIVRKYRRGMLWRMPSLEAAGLVSDRSLDFVFIDADHAYAAVRDDCLAWLPRVKPGGWLCGHDYENKHQPGVRKAVDDLFGSRVETDVNRTWFVRC